MASKFDFRDLSAPISLTRAVEVRPWSELEGCLRLTIHLRKDGVEDDVEIPIAQDEYEVSGTTDGPPVIRLRSRGNK